jgi:1-acyl-sn-glycerol-3-phosphate acyltransferase
MLDNPALPSVYSLPLRIRLSRRLLRPVFRGLFHMLSRAKISGKEYVPQSGAYLIAINHVSLYEAPFVLAFWPQVPEAVGAIDIWHRTGQSVLARLYGGIPVHRGEYNRQVLDTLLNVLRSGRPLLIAPEGGRSHVPGMRRALPGIAYLIEKARVPVVPAGIVGATDDFLKRALRGERPILEMRIGAPIHFPEQNNPNITRRESRQQTADLVMAHIAALLPLEYRGVYAHLPFLASKTG